MRLYNIHTHNVEIDYNNESVINVLNVYPACYYKEKNDYPNSFFSCGIHPWYTKNWEKDISLLTDIASDSRVAAIGEAGLDFIKKNSDSNTQLLAFRKQIELASTLSKPLIIHCVKAWDELLALYKEYKPSNTWIIHGYRGNPIQAQQLVKFGFKFSFGLNFNEETIKRLPLDYIFCETDDELISILTIYQRIASVLNLKIEYLADIIAKNVAETFFLK